MAQARTEPELLSAAHPDVTREHFIPLDKEQLVFRLADWFTPEAREAFLGWTRLADMALCQAAHERLASLRSAYAAFDPDSDVRRLGKQADDAIAIDWLFAQFRELIEQANFVELTQADIDEALSAASDWGFHLHVDTTAFERLQV
jgi:hypothetical protein